MEDAGWTYRRRLAQTKKQLRRLEQRSHQPAPGELANPFDQRSEEDAEPQGRDFDPAIDVRLPALDLVLFATGAFAGIRLGFGAIEAHM